MNDYEAIIWFWIAILFIGFCAATFRISFVLFLGPSPYGYESPLVSAIWLIIALPIIGFVFYAIFRGKKSSSLSKEGKKVKDMLYDTSGKYQRCPKCTSLVDMEIGVCRFCGYDLFNGEYTYKRRSSEDQVRIDYAKDLQKKKFKK